MANTVLKNVARRYENRGWNPNTFQGSPSGTSGTFGAQTYPSFSDSSFSGQSSTVPEYGSRAITYDDIISKTALLLGVSIIAAVLDYFLCAYVPKAGFALGTLGLLAAGGVVLATIFMKKISPVIPGVYAVGQGLAIGLMSFAVANLIGQVEAPWIVVQAAVGTAGVFLGALFIYKNRIIRVTPRFNKILIAALFGILALSLVTWVISLFTHSNPLQGSGPMSIGFSLVIIVVAALTLLSDFDQAEQLVKVGADKEAAWSVAFGLIVSILWIFTEILRLVFNMFYNND